MADARAGDMIESDMIGVKTVLNDIYTVPEPTLVAYSVDSIHGQGQPDMQTTDIRTALDGILNQQHFPLEEVLDRHFSPDYRQRTNGQWDDREAFASHARKLREVVASARFEVLDELRDGNRYADRHRVHVTKRDGTQVVQEVYLFAELDAEGRFARVEETTLMLAGAESDRGIGSVK